MGSKIKLLDRPLKTFILYALLVLCLSVPAYFLVIDHIWLSELDEHNEVTKNELLYSFKKSNYTEDELSKTLTLYNKLQPSNTITKSAISVAKPDSTYTKLSLNKFSVKEDYNRFRVLETHFLIHGQPYQATIQTNFEETDETLIAISLVTTLFFGLLVFGFILLNKNISKKIWQPFQDTLYRLKHFDLNNKQEIEFIPTEIKEFEQLHVELIKLMKRNVLVYEQQKIFLENASHELQTPLAVLKSKTDSLLQTDQLTKQQLEIINEMNIPLSRASRINKNLLLLAKIGNQSFEDDEIIDLQHLLKECIEMLSDYIIDKGIKLTLSFDGENKMKCNRILLESLINNLLINAIKHNVADGTIDIKVTSKTFEIANSGKTSLNSEVIFNRFSTGLSSIANSGLGLAIVKEITVRYGWGIQYSFTNDQHLFSINL